MTDTQLKSDRASTVHEVVAILPPCDTALDMTNQTAAYVESVGDASLSIARVALDGDRLRSIINHVTDLTNPRLSEVDWQAVATALNHEYGWGATMLGDEPPESSLGHGC